MSMESFTVLQRENHVLVRENNALHLEMIRIQEELDANVKSKLTMQKEYEHRIQELQFLNTQKTAQLQKKDGDLSKLYAQLQRLQGVNGGAMNESIEMTKHLPVGEDKSVSSNKPPTSGPVASDEKKWELQYESWSRENKELSEKISMLEAQVQARESEIERLGKQLKESISTKDYATVKAKYDLEARQLAQDLEKEQLLRQVDLLNDQVAKYERKIQDSLPLLQRNNILTEQFNQLQKRNEDYLSELTSLRQKFQNLEQEHLLCTSKATEQTEVAGKHETTIEELRGELQDSKQQITRLEHALKATHYDKVSSANNVANLEAHNKMLTTELNQLKSKLKDSLTQANETQNHNKQFSRQLETLEKELQTIQTKLATALADYQTSSEENTALRRECQSLEVLVQDRDKRIRQLQTALDTTNAASASLESKLKEMEASHLYENQKTRDLQSQNTSIYSEERAALRQENESLKQQVRQLDVQKKEIMNQLAAATTQVEHFRRQSEADQDQVSDKLIEIQQLQSQLKQVKSELLYLHEDKIKLESELAESRREVEKLLLQPAPDQNGRDSKWQQRLQDVLLSKQQLETQWSALKSSKESLELRLTKSVDELRLKDEQMNQLQLKVSTLQQQISALQSELTAAKQAKSYYESEYNQIMQKYGQQTHELQHLQHQIEVSQNTNADQSRQIQDLQSNLLKAQTKCNQLENLIEKTNTSRKSIELQLSLAQEDIQHMKEQQLSKDAKFKRMQQEISEQKSTLIQYEKDNEQLKLVVTELNRSQEKWIWEQKQTELQLVQVEQANEYLKTQLESSEESERCIQEEVKQLKTLLQSMDHEKDQLIATLDEKTEQINNMQGQTKRASQEQQDIRKQFQELQLTIRRLETALNEKEQDCQRLVTQLGTAESGSRKMKQDLDLLKAEQIALQGDLHHMTIENQSLASECTTLHHELDQITEDHRAIHNHICQVERERDTLRVELQDLKDTYRALVVEMDALEVTRNQLSATREEINGANAHLRHQIQQVTRERDDAVKQITELEAEHIVYTQQIKSLTLQLQQFQDKQDAQLRNQELLSGALHSQHQVATELANERVESAAHHSSLNQRIASFQAQLNNSVHERTQLTNQLAQLSLEKQQVETLLSSVRSQLATLQIQLQQEQEDKAALVEELNRQHQPNHHFDTNRVASNSSRQSSPLSYIPTIQEAEERCRSLEERLSRQDATIQQLEKSRSKFRKFAAKYESELEQRDRVIEALRSSQRSSPDRSLRSAGEVSS